MAKDEGDAYARELGLRRPVTVTTVKPSGTISKLFGLTEGAHLPARAQYLRWVQFKGTRDRRDRRMAVRVGLRCWRSTRRAAIRCANSAASRA